MSNLIKLLTMLSLSYSIYYFHMRIKADKQLAAGKPCDYQPMEIPPELLEAAQKLKLALEERMGRKLSLEEVSRYLNKYLQEGPNF